MVISDKIRVINSVDLIIPGNVNIIKKFATIGHNEINIFKLLYGYRKGCIYSATVI